VQFDSLERREFIALLGDTAAMWPFAVYAQQRVRPLIGLLPPGSAAAQVETINAVRQGLKEPGFVEGENIAIEIALAGGQFEKLPELAVGLVRRQARVIIALGVAATVGEDSDDVHSDCILHGRGSGQPRTGAEPQQAGRQPDRCCDA
jgi:ABC-type uncharacterized transport system substrate-binding protein